MNVVLTQSEFMEIARYTAKKIKKYPKSCGKDMSYFHYLFPDEIKNYIVRRDTNDLTLKRRETYV